MYTKAGIYSYIVHVELCNGSPYVFYGKQLFLSEHVVMEFEKGLFKAVGRAKGAKIVKISYQYHKGEALKSLFNKITKIALYFSLAMLAVYTTIKFK